MKTKILKPRSSKAICVASTLVALSLGTNAAHAACNYDVQVGECKLSAELTSQGLKVATNGASCATVDYQVNGATRRMYIDNQTGMDATVTAASSGIQVISCKSYSDNRVLSTTSLANPSLNLPVTNTQVLGTNRVSEQVVSTNIVATGSKMVQVNVPVYEKRIYVERQVPVEKRVYVEKPVYIEKRVPVEQKVYVERPVYIERQVPVEKKVVVHQKVPVDRPVYVPYYLKPEVAVRYNQLVPGLPSGYQGQMPSQAQFQGQFPNQFQGQFQGQYPNQFQGQFPSQYQSQNVGQFAQPTTIPYQGQ